MFYSLCKGHEREDVVVKRKEFVEYFLQNKHLYYFAHRDSKGEAIINIPEPTENEKKRILISHDESTFRSGELTSHRWLFAGMEPFLSKGRGRSIMVSAFIVQHTNTDVFELDEDEWQEAIKADPQLATNDEFLNYFPRSANAWIEPKKDNYFDNTIILRQFERLFRLIKFKKLYRNHQIEILVDNARTHSAKVYDVSLLNKSAGTKCPYKYLEWKENEEVKRIELYDNEGVSKGLFAVAKELKLIDQNTLSKEIKLEQLREIVSKHAAFEVNTRLEQLEMSLKLKSSGTPSIIANLTPLKGSGAI